MPRRIHVFLAERFPVLPGVSVAAILFGEIYFLVLLTNRTAVGPVRLGGEEAVGAYTLLAFLLTLRIADDLKDFQTDKRLFPDRPLADGRVRRGDVIVLMAVVDVLAIGLNVAFMNNLGWFAFLAVYGTAMSFWFFAKAKIQPNLMLALVTHNPVQIVMNLYVISFAAYKYGIPLITLPNVAIALTLYFPGLVWEVARKLRAPEQETDYVTYSKLFGPAKPLRFILAILAVDLLTTGYLLYQLYPWAAVLVLVPYVWLVWQARRWLAGPTAFTLVSRVQWYEYAAEGTVVVLIAASLAGWGHG
ncbi:MAG: hypothetical protein LBJ02_08700 [Bifidobacteriaceae bacterium]|jgi:4-hydroxybenzoate polyprenyltransferase|nr:hypothetical protein [Bifidobacteriaceae bacterium]